MNRRALLRTAAVGSTVAIAGCGSLLGSARYQLFAFPVGEPFPDTFRWEPDTLYAAQQQRLMNKLLQTGTLTTTGFTIVPMTDGSESAIGVPRFVENDGTYYRIDATETETVNVRQWLLWLDRVTENPPDDYGTPESLSALDRHAFEQALSETDTEFGPVDVATLSPADRGYVFHQVEADETAWLPDPPFEYIRENGSGTERYYEIVVERVMLPAVQYEYTIEPIAESEAGYVQYVYDNLLRASFSTQSLPTGAADVLATLTSRSTYQETAPLSDGYETLLDALGFGRLTPAGARRSSEDIYFEYQNRYYYAWLSIFT